MKYPLAIALAFGCATPALAAGTAAERFGAREDVLQISLAPDGNHVAILQATGGRAAAVIVIDVHTGAQNTVLRSAGTPDRLTSCRWPTAVRLVCSVYMIVDSEARKLAFTRMLAIDVDGKNLKLLSAHDASKGLEIN